MGKDSWKYVLGFSGSGGDWEVMMLADELERRERRDDGRALLPPYLSALRDLEEVTFIVVFWSRFETKTHILSLI